MTDRSGLKAILYGGLLELAKNNNLYYHSAVGQKYSHLTEAGEQVVIDFVNNMLYEMLEQEEKELDKRAKDLVVKGLKGENI